MTKKSRNWPEKDPDGADWFFFVLCDIDGTNDGSTSDDGDLQGSDIASYTLTVPSGITNDTDNQDAVTIKGVAYSANTVVSVKFSGGTAGTDYTIKCAVTTNDTPARVLPASMVLPVRTVYGESQE